jgi:hypothetical protein
MTNRRANLDGYRRGHDKFVVPRDPNDDEDEEDDEHGGDEDDDHEPAVIREPDGD